MVALFFKGVYGKNHIGGSLKSFLQCDLSTEITSTPTFEAMQ